MTRFFAAQRLLQSSITSLSVGLLLSGCSSLHTLKEMNPEANDFPSSLAAEYLAFAESEAEQLHWASAERFGEKGLRAMRGKNVFPEDPVHLRSIPQTDREAMTEARYRLLSALSCGANEVVPQIAARAQLMFDCWVEKTATVYEPTYFGPCKDGYNDAMTQVEEAIEPLKESETDSGRYQFYFGLESTTLRKDERAQIQSIAETLMDVQYYKIEVTGYADASGSRQHNKVLSLRRAKAVKEALVKAGLKSEKITVSAAGEPRSARKLQDREARRVEVKVEAYQ